MSLVFFNIVIHYKYIYISAEARIAECSAKLSITFCPTAYGHTLHTVFKTDAFIMKSLKFPIPCIFMKDTEFSQRRQNQSRSAFVSSDGEKMLFW